MSEFKDRQSNIEQQPAEIVVEKYQPNSWENIREQIMAIEGAAFNQQGFDEHFMKQLFENKSNFNYLLKNAEGQVIGYTQATIQAGDSAYIMNTAIAPEYQGKGYVAKLMQNLEAELKARGIKWITRDAAVENGYADKIQKHYGDRIVETYEHTSPWGLQRYFKIKL